MERHSALHALLEAASVLDDCELGSSLASILAKRPPTKSRLRALWAAEDDVAAIQHRRKTMSAHPLPASACVSKAADAAVNVAGPYDRFQFPEPKMVDSSMNTEIVPMELKANTSHPLEEPLDAGVNVQCEDEAPAQVEVKLTTPSDAGKAGVASLAPGPAETTQFIEPRTERWQWEHRTGFKDYAADVSERLEQAYQSGHRKVRIKTGKEGDVPMMFFFLDNLQYDPKSGRSRAIRRVGPDTLSAKLERWFRSFYLEVTTGQSRKLTLERYLQQRDDESLGKFGKLDQSKLDAQRKKQGQGDREVSQFSVVQATCRSRLKALRRVCRHITRSPWYKVLSGSLVFVYLWWMAYEIPLSAGTFNPGKEEASTWQKILVIIVEAMFCIILSTEIGINLLGAKDAMTAVSMPDNAIDLLVVTTMIMDSCLRIYRLGTDMENSVAQALKVVRLIRIFRLNKALSTLSPKIATLMHGLALDMKSVAAVFAILMVMTFAFGLCFVAFYYYDRVPFDILRNETQANDDFPVLQFDSIGQSMWTLTMHGLLLDDIATVSWNLQYRAGNIIVCVFGVYVGLANFIILNMLIGFLCDVVTGVSAQAEQEKEANFLRHNLVGLLEAYDKEGEGALSEDDFNHLLRDPELHQVLKSFDADLATLLSMAEVMFEDTKSLSYSAILDAVLDVRGSQAARVTDVNGVRKFLRHRLDHLEALVNPASKRNRSRHTAVNKWTMMEKIADAAKDKKL